MAASYIHTCYRILDPERSEDFYVNKLGLKKVGEMDLGSATNHFFALEEDPSEPMLELTHNHDRTELYDMGDGYAHVAFVVDDLEGTVARLKDEGVTVTLEPKTLTADGNDYRIAFVEDPDGYKIELVQRGTMKVGGMIQ
ncbi:MAG TPA: VOC family protein [Rubrobacteraceae bacterium]|nr:VOC family protein [Rubrobacteraceae bacterium]